MREIKIECDEIQKECDKMMNRTPSISIRLGFTQIPNFAGWLKTVDYIVVSVRAYATASDITTDLCSIYCRAIETLSGTELLPQKFKAPSSEL